MPKTKVFSMLFSLSSEHVKKKPVELCGGCPALQNEHVFNFGIHGVMRFEVVAKRVEIAYSFISMGWWEDGDNPWSLRLQNYNEL